jgi:hypothetical protein
MFGELPAYAFYVRHANGVRFSNVRVRASLPDLRHAMVFDDAEGVAIDGLDAGISPGAVPAMKLVQARDVIISGCQPHGKDATFLQITGRDTRSVALTGNDFGGVLQGVTMGPEVPKGAVRAAPKE